MSWHISIAVTFSNNENVYPNKISPRYYKHRLNVISFSFENMKITFIKRPSTKNRLIQYLPFDFRIQHKQRMQTMSTRMDLIHIILKWLRFKNVQCFSFQWGMCISNGIKFMVCVYMYYFFWWSFLLLSPHPDQSLKIWHFPIYSKHDLCNRRQWMMKKKMCVVIVYCWSHHILNYISNECDATNKEEKKYPKPKPMITLYISFTSFRFFRRRRRCCCFLSVFLWW